MKNLHGKNNNNNININKGMPKSKSTEKGKKIMKI